MIDRSKEFWAGDTADDINEYLCEYSEQEDIEIKPVECQMCKSDIFTLKVDQDEGAIEVTCIYCKTKKHGLSTVFLGFYLCWQALPASIAQFEPVIKDA